MHTRKLIFHVNIRIYLYPNIHNLFKGETNMFPQLSKELNPYEVMVEMNTTMGSIKIKLFPEHAPKTVENFLEMHAKSGYYNGIIFHRVIPNFMIQVAIQLVQVWAANQFGAVHSKTSVFLNY